MSKKKNNLSEKDLKDWQSFIENPTNINNKDQSKTFFEKKENLICDLHGYKLSDANNKVRELIEHCFNKNIKNLLLITGKGLHSNTDKNVYISKDFSKLRFSVPDYISSNPEIKDKVISLTTENKKKGGEGVLVIKIKSKNKFR